MVARFEVEVSGPNCRPQRTDVSVQLVLNQTRLHAAPELFLIHFQHVLHVFGKIEDDGVAHRLTGERRAAAARQNGDANRLAISITACTSPLVARHDDADGLDLINRRIRGIKQARVTVEANIAFDALSSIRLRSRNDLCPLSRSS